MRASLLAGRHSPRSGVIFSVSKNQMRVSSVPLLHFSGDFKKRTVSYFKKSLF
jgi:hypothetical protein